MRLSTILVTACMAVSFPVRMPAAEFKPDEQNRAAQAIAETADFDWMAVPPAERGAWGAVRIVPAVASGFFEVPVRQDENDKTETGVIYQVYDIRRGDWSLIAPWRESSEKRAVKGHFLWDEPMIEPIRIESPQTMGFATKAGLPSECLVRFVEPPAKVVILPGNQKESRPWDRLVWLPNGWGKAFAEAWQRQPEIDAAFENPNAKPSPLPALALDPNGPIALAAVRRLIAAKEMNVELAGRMLARAEGVEAGVLSYFIAANVDEKDLPAYERMLTETVSKAKTFADLKSWVAGALASANFAWKRKRQHASAVAILAAARKRALELGVDPVKERAFFETKPFNQSLYGINGE